MKALALSLLVACTPMQRAGVLAASSTALLIADWRQTQTITHDCLELNPIIGACGEHVPVNVYFPLVIAAHLAVGALLPTGWREAWFGAISGAELNAVWTNESLQ